MELNPKQREAVEHRDGPLLVVAGAGTGKTRVITHRIAHLIANGIKPSEILAVTFTNKAAAEMRDRVQKLIQDSAFTIQHLPFVGTFHSLGVHILRESGQALGISRWFTIYDRDDSISLIRKSLKSEGLDPKQFAPAAVLSSISKAKGNLISREDFMSESGSSYFGEVVARVWQKYESELREQKALDFDDLLVKTVELLANYEDVRKHYQSRWRYIHVDEYQDTNKVQYEMIRLLTGEYMNICCVGDSDQTIYTWRGATIENIMGFEEDFPGAKVVILEENYRSTSNILNAANQVISKNDNRKDKNLFTSSGEGEKISIYEAFDPSDEACFVTGTVTKMFNGKSEMAKVRYEKIAVLYRANFQSRALEEAFLEAGIPYTVLGTRFFERAEVKDIISYVKSALNPDDKMSLSRAAGTPRRGIGDKSLEDYWLGGRASEKLQTFFALLQDFKNKLENLPLPDALKYIVRVSGYEEMLKKSEEQERLENIQELVNLSSKYNPPAGGLDHEEALEKFLTDAGLASDQDTLLHEKMINGKGARPAGGGGKLMTVHAAKGLEFEHVFIVGLEQDLFPHRPMDDDWSKEKFEEERRLFYVALTRAKKQVYLSWCQSRQMYGETRVQMKSEYLGDIPNSLLESASEVEPLGSFRVQPRGSGYLPDLEDII